MIDFLKDYGIKNETIDELNNKYFDSMLFNINNNELEIAKIINYFKTLGITCIDELLIENTELFLLTFDEVKTKITKYDINKLAESLNQDYHVIYQI